MYICFSVCKLNFDNEKNYYYSIPLKNIFVFYCFLCIFILFLTDVPLLVNDGFCAKTVFCFCSYLISISICRYLIVMLFCFLSDIYMYIGTRRR